MSNATDAVPRPDEAVTMARVEEVHEAFNSRDVHRIAACFAEDAVFYMASGPEPVGRTVRGRDAIRKLLADRFLVIPDMAWELLYGYTAGARAVTVWRVTGHAADGTVLDHQGCDLLEFRDGLVERKDTYWKIVRREDPWSAYEARSA
jgi:ketosteroid isomerase-like protein